ncbi:MAG: branched-chain amino acid ABC transporter permease [Armatimonadota bacterium]|nr:branched-chain amino acid ABC transporter permease [Armatimonadota bacterium]
MILLQSIVNGVLLGLVYALIAAGLSLIFGLMEIVNFAHGQHMMLAMYGAYWLAVLYRVDPLFSLPLWAFALFLLGVATYWLVIARVLQAPMLAQIFSTFGLGVFLQSLAQFLWSPDFRLVPNPVVKGRVEVFGLFLGIPELVASLGAVIAFALLYLFVTRTETGRALQATSEDREAAALMGIDSHRMFALGWGIGLACVGVAGVLLSNFYYIFPEVGFPFALIAYVAVALGGFGSIPGAFVAGIIIGLVEVLSGLLIGPAYKYLFVFLVYLIVVIARPQGLFGRY